MYGLFGRVGGVIVIDRLGFTSGEGGASARARVC
jgi:hypothetical protein